MCDHLSINPEHLWWYSVVTPGSVLGWPYSVGVWTQVSYIPNTCSARWAIGHRPWPVLKWIWICLRFAYCLFTLMFSFCSTFTCPSLPHLLRFFLLGGLLRPICEELSARFILATHYGNYAKFLSVLDWSRVLWVESYRGNVIFLSFCSTHLTYHCGHGSGLLAHYQLFFMGNLTICSFPSCPVWEKFMCAADT